MASASSSSVGAPAASTAAASSATSAKEAPVVKNPDLEIAQRRFLVAHEDVAKDARERHWRELVENVRAHDMAPFYATLCAELKRTVDEPLLAKMKATNEEKLAALEARIEDAQKNQGESEVRQALLAKAEYLCEIGDKQAALTAFQTTYDKTVGTGYKIDLVFNVIRLGLFFLDHKLVAENITKAKELMEKGGDWDRKNRLRSYEGLHKMTVRDFSAAADLFLEAVPTFDSRELMRYEELVYYTVLCSLLALDRPDLRKRVITCNEIREQLTSGGQDGELLGIRELLDSFYGGRYDAFFQQLGDIEAKSLKFDRYFHSHAAFYTRTMRERAYAQFLQPYQTVRLDMMARDFNVTSAFIDRELHALIGQGRLACRIDSVSGVLHISRRDQKNELYKEVVRDGDALLNRMQKLARIVHA